MQYTTSKCLRGLLGVLAFATVTTLAATGVWTNVSSGYWADSNNWENAYVPLGAGDCADFRVLGSGGTVTITNNTGIGAILFSGAEDDVWAIAAEAGAAMGWDNRPLPAALGTSGEICVEGGVLNLQPAFYWGGYGIVKAGSGGLRLGTSYTYPVSTRLDEGTLLLTNNAALSRSAVLFNATNAMLTLEADARVGGVASLVDHTSNINLNGHTLWIGGSEKNYEWDGQLLGGGALAMVCGEFQTLTATQNLTAVQLDNGHLQLGKTVGRTVAWYRFESLGTLVQDSGTLGNSLTTVGAPSWENDPVRGGVLALNGASYLKGSGSNAGLFGLPTGNSPFTVAFWLKLDHDVNSEAGLFQWGAVYANYNINGMRLNTPLSSTPLLYTNWGNNRNIPSSVSLANGAWHHVAIVYTGFRHQFYVDGLLCLDAAQDPKLNVLTGNFRLGGGWSALYFKGLIDDFVIADWAMNVDELYTVRVEGQEPDLSGYAQNNLLPATTGLEVGYNGSLHLLGDQTFATLGGEGAAGGVSLQNGGTLTAAGGGSTTSTVFLSALSGDGRFVKRGADYTLTLGGGNTYTGATEVQEGTLALTPRGIHGLQAYYRFDDPANLGKDSSGNDYDLLAQNTPSYVTSGKIDGAAGFSWSNKDMLVAGRFPATLPTYNSSYTFAVWCNPSSGNALGMPLYWGSKGGGNGSASLVRFDGTTRILVSNFGNNQIVEAGFDLFADTLNSGWHHIASTYDGVTRSRNVYIDGILKFSGSNAANLVVTNQIFQLGGAPYSNANFYDGLLDEVMIFDRALSPAEIQLCMAGTPLGLKSQHYTSKRVAHYRFEEEGNPGKDSGAYEYDLATSNRVSLTGWGKRGKALELSASTFGCLMWTNSVFPEMLPTGNQAVTVSAWINPRTGADPDGSVAFWGKIVNGRKQCHLVRLRSFTSGRLGLSYTDGVPPNVETNVVDGLDFGSSPEGWHHVATVYSAGNRVLYIDGVRVAQDNRDNLAVSAGAFYIGSKGTGSWFQGLIDEVEIYNCALSHKEILEVMRGGTDILPVTTAVQVSGGARVDVNGAMQRVAALQGAGEVDVGGGVLTVAGGTGVFSGMLTGGGEFAVRDGAVQTLAGAGTFSGAVTVSNATLLVENANGSVTGDGCVVTIQDGGLVGGSGAFSGDVLFENGAGFAAGTGTATLTVGGTVTLGASGSVILEQPEGFSGGRFTLITAMSISAPSGISGWTVTPTPVNMETAFRASGGALTLSVFRQGTILKLK